LRPTEQFSASIPATYCHTQLRVLPVEEQRQSSSTFDVSHFLCACLDPSSGFPTINDSAHLMTPALSAPRRPAYLTKVLEHKETLQRHFFSGTYISVLILFVF
jgi:hypothetical protein